jgi:pilus assembly protein Flp/PilA
VGQLVRFATSEEGATAVEYALIAGLLSVVVLVGFLVLTDELGGLYDRGAGDVGDAVDGAGGS